MAISATHEIFSTHVWDILPSALHGYKKTIEENMALRIPFAKSEDRDDRSYFVSSKSGYNDRIYIGNPGSMNMDRLDDDDQVICVIKIDGAILRNGGACSYGSKEHRDIMRNAADDGHTIGVLIVSDSPGGSSYAKYDYEDAINYVRSKGIPVVGLVDGMACSAAYTPIAMCDESYARSVHDQIGCIGTMAALYANKDGDTNTVTQARYIEVYAEGSPYKNKDIRDAANGDNDELQKQVNELCTDYQNMVAKYRPRSTEEQRKGAVFKAADVVGTLIDGIGTIESCVGRIMELSAASKKKTPQTPQRKSSNDGATAPITDDATNQQQPPINNKTMDSNKYPKTMLASGVNALVVDEEKGSYFSTQMIESLEAYVAKAEQNESALAAKVQEATQLNVVIEQLKADNAQALADAAAAHATEIANLTAAHSTTVSELQQSLDDAKAKIATQEAEIIELSEATNEPPAPAAGAPNGNKSEGTQTPEFQVESISKAGMTPSEKKKAWDERMALLADKRFQ